MQIFLLLNPLDDFPGFLNISSSTINAILWGQASCYYKKITYMEFTCCIPEEGMKTDWFKVTLIAQITKKMCILQSCYCKIYFLCLCLCTINTTENSFYVKTYLAIKLSDSDQLNYDFFLYYNQLSHLKLQLYLIIWPFSHKTTILFSYHDFLTIKI